MTAEGKADATEQVTEKEDRKRVDFMKMKNVFVFEITEEEKEVLNKAIKILNDKNGFNYYKHNSGGKIIERVEDTIKLLQGISEGKLFDK